MNARRLRFLLPLQRAGSLLGVFGLFLIGILPVGLSAQPATGSVSGVVSNSTTRKVLERADVRVNGTSLSTLTDANGSFRLLAVPSGAQTLAVSYAGLDEQQISVNVPAGGTATVDVVLKSEVYQLNDFKVAAELEGNAYAVQQQKNAESQRTVISADAFGVITDSNPGEFLKSLPGLQMDYTGVEPRRLVIRGLEPNLNQVMINGNQAAAAASSSSDRAFEFDQTSIDSIESIEVFKAPLPNMPANAIGGAVNLITRSAFLQKGRRIRAAVNLTGNTEAFSLNKSSGPDGEKSRKILPGGFFMFSDSFLNNRLGVVLSLSNTRVWGMGNTAYNTYTYVAPPATGMYTKTNPAAYVREYRREDHQNYNRRRGLSLNLDFKASESTTVFLRNTLTDHFYEFRNRFFIVNNGGSVNANFTPTHVESLPVAASVAQQSMSFGDKRSVSWSFNPGAKHEFGPWKINYDASYSKATNHYTNLPRYFGAVNITNPGVGFTLDKPEGSAVASRLVQTAGADMYNLDSYQANNAGNNFVSVGPRNATDQITSGKGSIRREFVAKVPFYVEAGGFYQEQKRSKGRANRRWSWVGPDGVAGTADDTASMGQFAELNYTPDIGFGERAPDRWVSPFRLSDAFTSTPRAFLEDLPYAYEQWFINNQQVKETITAGYVMGNVKLGPVDVLAGVRIENTDVEGVGPRRQNSLVPAGVDPNSLQGMIAKYSRAKTTTSYTPNPFKYLHLTYHATSKLQARASYTEAIGRPNFGNILPNTVVDDAARTVSLNNTELKPQRAHNYDVSLEYYPQSTSSLTFAWFRKDIKDYINTNTAPITAPNSDLGIGSELVGYNLTTQNNLGSALIEGYELGGRYTLGFINPNLNNFELFGNYTQLYKTEGNFAAAATTTLKELPNTARWFWNGGASYRGFGGKLYLMLKANFVSDITLNTGQAHLQRDDRLTVDGEIRYRISSRYELSLAARNIGNVTEGEAEVSRSTRTGNGGGTAMTLTLSGNF